MSANTYSTLKYLQSTYDCNKEVLKEYNVMETYVVDTQNKSALEHVISNFRVVKFRILRALSTYFSSAIDKSLNKSKRDTDIISSLFGKVSCYGEYLYIMNFVFSTTEATQCFTMTHWSETTCYKKLLYHIMNYSAPTYTARLKAINGLEFSLRINLLNLTDTSRSCCDLCGRRFTDISKFRTHLRTYSHGVIIGDTTRASILTSSPTTMNKIESQTGKPYIFEEPEGEEIYAKRKCPTIGKEIKEAITYTAVPRLEMELVLTLRRKDVNSQYGLYKYGSDVDMANQLQEIDRKNAYVMKQVANLNQLIDNLQDIVKKLPNTDLLNKLSNEIKQSRNHFIDSNGIMDIIKEDIGTRTNNDGNYVPVKKRKKQVAQVSACKKSKKREPLETIKEGNNEPTSPFTLPESYVLCREKNWVEQLPLPLPLPQFELPPLAEPDIDFDFSFSKPTHLEIQDLELLCVEDFDESFVNPDQLELWQQQLQF